MDIYCVGSGLRILEEWKESHSEWVRLEDESIRNIHEFLNHLHIHNKVLEQKFSLSHHRGLEDLETSAHNFASPLNINILQVNNVPVQMTEDTQPPNGYSRFNLEFCETRDSRIL